MAAKLPPAPDAVTWYHQAASAPLRALTSLDIGPFGGENSISAVIESVLAFQKGETPDFPLSKSEQFFVDQLVKSGEVPDEMLEYRELSHTAEEEVLRRWHDDPMAVIWLGAGVFNFEHPLLKQRNSQDWHVWTDANPKVVREARVYFEEMRERGDAYNLTYDVTLPYDVTKLNTWLDLITTNLRRLVIFGYGVTYALTMRENYEWLSRLKLPAHVDTLFAFNAPAPKINFIAGLMASFHNQRMVSYDDEAVEALFSTTVPGSEVVWRIPREETRNQMWSTWLIESTAASRQQAQQ